MSEHVNLAVQSPHTTDRREYRRLQIGSLAYVDLDRSNGGLILNISEGGIAVQAAQILAEDLFPEMRFRLPKSEAWIKSAGKIVWQGKSRKEAGIQFVNLSEDNRRLIHDWICSETFAPLSPAEEDRPKNLQEAPKQTTENVRLNPISSSNSSELNAMFPSEKTSSSVEGLGTHRNSFSDVGPKAANSGSVELTNQIASESVKNTKGSEEQLPAMTPVEILRQAMTPKVERPGARHTVEKHAGKGFPDIPVLNTRFPSEAPPHEKQPVAPNPIHIEVPTRGYWRPFSGYEVQPETPSRKRSILTSILCFAAGLGLAFLIMRGSWSLKNILFQPEHPSVADSTTSGRQPEPSASPNTEAQPASPDDLAQQTPAPSSDIPIQTASRSPSASSGGVIPSMTPRSIQSKSESTIAGSGNEAKQHQTQGTNIIPSEGQSTDARGIDNTPTPPQNERTLDAYAQENRKVPMAPNNASPGAEPVQTPQTSGTDKNRTGFPSSQGAITPLGTVAIRSHFDSVRNAPAPDPDSSGSTLQIGQLISIRQPVYPPEAARRRIEGTVRLQAVVAENGVVETVKLLSGPPGLVASAINAVQDWRYGPTFLDGHPIESMEDVTVEFRLANSTPSPR